MSGLPVFSESALENILLSAKKGEIHVVSAPTGCGESTSARRLLAERLDPGHPYPLTQVLWSVNSVLGEDSLGEEAAGAFREAIITAKAPATVGIVKGKTGTKLTAKDFRKQFVWPVDPGVKVISHTRLGMMLGLDADRNHRTLAGADLLVIDEDPASSLLINSPSEKNVLTAEQLAGTGHPLLVAIAKLAGSGRAEPFNNIKGEPTGYGLYGYVFWSLLNRLHSGPIDVVTLTQALKKLKVPDAGYVAQCLADDTPGKHAHLAKSQRFGLDWDGKTWPSEKPACFRYNLLRSLTPDLPVVILDGYADEVYYKALFPNATVHFHEFDPGECLEVQCAWMLKVDAARENTKVQLHQRHQIASEIAYRAKRAQGLPLPQDTLVLTSLRLRQPWAHWQRILGDEFRYLGLTLTKDARSGHWHAGRGSNAHEGCQVYGLHQPYLNVRHREYTLAALFPEDASERDRMHKYLKAAEALQMLNRGRQTRYRVGDKPDVVLAMGLEDAEEFFGPFSTRVKLSEYEPHFQFTKHSNNPRWRDYVAALGEELLVLFPNGLPRRLLEVLPKHDGFRAAKVSPRLLARHELVKAGLADYAATLSSDNPLQVAFHAPFSGTYCDLPQGGGEKDRKMEEDAMGALGLMPYASHGVGRPIIYARCKADVTKAQADFNAWIATLPPVSKPISPAPLV